MFQDSIVCVPTFSRPEFLALSLEKISQASDAPDDVRIFLDTSSEDRVKEVEYVRDTYLPRALIFHAKEHEQLPSGMWNILSSLKAGYQTGKEYIFLIEEDVLIYPKQFFSWHQQAQKSGMYFATCGRIHPRFPNYKFYQNPGACFNRDMLELVVEHINKDLFADRRKYMDLTFGKMEESSDLDDGLIRRVARFHGLPVLFPDTPKCAHQGFRAYNKFIEFKNEGNIEQRIEQLRLMLAKIDPNGRYSRDFEPFVESN